ncbi:MAG: hypothetical protein HYT80_08910 [Euryarchaeota archaeon]|nr:hypothetical protein [Euryarchaeota archaeon]
MATSDVNSGESFWYRTLFAFWKASGHITYFMDTTEDDGDAIDHVRPLGCFGEDVHVQGGAPNTPYECRNGAGGAEGTQVSDSVMCINDTANA